MSKRGEFSSVVASSDRRQWHPCERRADLSGMVRLWRLGGWWALIMLVLLPLLAACGGVAQGRDAEADGPSRQVATTAFSSEEAAQTVEVRVDPSGRLAWERAEYTAVAGDVTFVVSNPARLAHEFAIEGPSVRAQSPVFESGTTNRYTLQGLQPGVYRIVCTVPGHREAGMTALLQIR